MKTKIFASLRLAVPRFVLGTLGVWCSLGPIILLNVSGSASLALTAVLVLLLLLCYAALMVICLRAKWDALKELLSETGLALCFMITGLLTNEITGTFVAIKHKLVIVYAFVGFLIAELIKPEKCPSAASAEFDRDQTADPIKPATEGDHSEERAAAELSNQNDGRANNISVHSENQRTLSKCERGQSRSTSEGTGNERLQETVHCFRNRLEASESRLTQSTVRIQEAVALGATLHAEIAALKQQIAAREDAIEALQSAVQRMAKIESENQRLSFENQRLQEELNSHRTQLDASENRLQELARRNQQVSDCYVRLETEVADLKRWPNDSQSMVREIDSASQQLAIVESRDSLSGTQMEKEEEARSVGWTSVKRQWRVGAIAATVMLIAGTATVGIRGTKLSASKEAAVEPETSFQEYAVEAASKAQNKAAPRLQDTTEIVKPTGGYREPSENSARRLRGIFETVQPTRLYSGPTEDSALIADIRAGMKINVVDSSYGWLEIRSKHGRPPGFIRQEAAVRIAWN